MTYCIAGVFPHQAVRTNTTPVPKEPSPSCMPLSRPEGHPGGAANNLISSGDFQPAVRKRSAPAAKTSTCGRVLGIESWAEPGRILRPPERKGPHCLPQAAGRNMAIRVASGEGSEGEKRTEEMAM